MNRTTLKSVLAASVCTMLLAGPALAQEEPRRGGILTHVVESETNTFDCHASGTSFTLQAVSPHFSTLLRFVPNDYSNVEGDLAESWEVSEDGTVFTFKLRQGVTFHDGSEFTAADIKASWDRIVSPPEGVVSVRQARYADIESIEIIDDHTIEFTLSAPNSAAESLFASPWNCIYSAADLEADPNFPSANINGTGPFRFAEYEPGSHWSYERFDDYFREGQPYLDGIRAVFLSGPGVVNALAGGQVDATFFLISPEDAQRVKAARGDDVVIQDADNYILNLLTVNTEKEPFNDERVRRALNLAIDRQQGTEVLPQITILRGYGTMLPPGSPYALDPEEASTLPGLGTDIEASRAEARRLLEEAGVSNLSFTLLNRSLRHPWEPLGIFLIDQWRQTGIEVTMQAADTPTYFSALNSGNYDVAIDFNNTTTAEPAEVLSKFVPGNPADYSFQGADPEMSAMYEEIVRTQDEDRRRELAEEFQRRVIEKGATIPMFWSFRPVVQDARLRGWTVSPSTVINLDMGGVWFAE